MKVHILGIAGTFMAGIALIAKKLGYDVIGTDSAIYPPMSEVLLKANIPVKISYDSHNFEDKPDLVIIGNALSRGNPLVEKILDDNIPFTSGPAWLHDEILSKKHVIAVAGTHGKTTTSSMITWILTLANMDPGYLIGGVPQNLYTSANCTDSNVFVIEADEYDTAFFDKRPKFISYKPNSLVLNNLEFDHADIYNDLNEIKKQFHYLVRLVPSTGKIIYPGNSLTLNEVIAMGCWSQQIKFQDDNNSSWGYELLTEDGSKAVFTYNGAQVAKLDWSLWGEHNVANALAAFITSLSVGVSKDVAIKALESFKPPARRMELLSVIAGIPIFSDFAHHPTAIRTTISSMKKRYPSKKLVCVLELGSFTMRAGVHARTLPWALSEADEVYILHATNLSWDVKQVCANLHNASSYNSAKVLLLHLTANRLSNQEVIVFMGNSSFSGVLQEFPKLLADTITVKAG